MKIYIYLKSGVVDSYEVASVTKAREHAWKIWQGGYRMKVGDKMEWYGKHWIDKIVWDMPEDDYMSKKYEGEVAKK